MSKIKSFTDLNVWKEAHNLVIQVYSATGNFPEEEKYGLSNQLRRASVSITSNIAEGFGMRTHKGKSRYYYNAQGSINEVKSQLLLARDLGFLNSGQFKNLAASANSVHRMLLRLIRSTKSLKKDL